MCVGFVFVCMCACASSDDRKENKHAAAWGIYTAVAAGRGVAKYSSAARLLSPLNLGCRLSVQGSGTSAALEHGDAARRVGVISPGLNLVMTVPSALL